MAEKTKSLLKNPIRGGTPAIERSMAEKQIAIK